MDEWSAGISVSESPWKRSVGVFTFDRAASLSKTPDATAEAINPPTILFAICSTEENGLIKMTAL